MLHNGKILEWILLIFVSSRMVVVIVSKSLTLIRVKIHCVLIAIFLTSFEILVYLFACLFTCNDSTISY